MQGFITLVLQEDLPQDGYGGGMKPIIWVYYGVYFG